MLNHSVSFVKNITNGGADKYPDIHFLAIERPGRLRPDAVRLSYPFNFVCLILHAARNGRLSAYHGWRGSPRGMDSLYLALRFERTRAWLAFTRNCIGAYHINEYTPLDFRQVRPLFPANQSSVINEQHWRTRRSS